MLSKAVRPIKVKMWHFGLLYEMPIYKRAVGAFMDIPKHFQSEEHCYSALFESSTKFVLGKG